MHTINIVLASVLALTAAGNICDSGLYKALAPLSSYPPAQSLCAQRFPKSTVTVTVSRSAPRRRVEAPRASTTTNQAPTTSAENTAVAAANRKTSSTTLS